MFNTPGSKMATVKGLLAALLCCVTTGHAAEVEIPESRPAAPGASIGEIIFSVGEMARPAEGRHQVTAGREVQVCLRLDPEQVPLMGRLQEGMLGYRLILEDSQDPPHILVIAPGNRLERMARDEQGCYAGGYTIPRNSVAGVYQVADLLIAKDDQSYYSIRDYLFDFSQVDELDIQNPRNDLEPPVLLKVSNYRPSQKKLKTTFSQYKIRIGQVFLFEDALSGLKTESMKIRYALLIDGHVTAYPEAKCQSTRPHKRFYCKVDLARPDFEWGPRQVDLKLESIYIEDKAGNKLSLHSPEEWAEQAQGAQTEFQFPPNKRLGRDEDYDLQRDPLFK